MKSRQMTLPCNLSASMSYLQVPGQERGQARLSPVERRLRLPMGGMDGVGSHHNRRRLQDQSQIVDLIFPLKPVSSRASETSKTPHS